MEPVRKKINQYFKLLEAQRFCNKQKIKEILICSCGYKEGHTPPSLSEFVPYEPDSVWCNAVPDTHAWFHFALDVTPEMCKLPLCLEVEVPNGSVIDKPQYILYINGKLLQGMDPNHTQAYLDAPGHYDVDLYAYSGRIPGRCRLNASLVNINPDVEALYYDIKIPLDTLKFLDPNSRDYAMTLSHLDNAVSMLDLYELGSEAFFASIKRARTYMTEEFYGKYCREQPSTVLCVGHTHIDCAWLWTLKQTREKVQRSFSTVIELMRRYPDYKFTSSQPLLYKYLKEEAPEVYEEVKRLVKEGRWECEGAMWVEADCNISSGESLVRQIIYGKRFFREEFGKDNRVLWLPDVFGYSAALPQILKKSGVDWFVTSKIAWNDTNTMPYETFAWKGLDGSVVNTYFLTAKDVDNPEQRITYNGGPSAAMLAGTYDRYTHKALSDEVMLTYGYGDGGGGPTSDQLERIARAKQGIPGLPNARTGFVGEFLSRMDERIKDKNIPQWSGELYLEFHRGTYTSIAKNKRNNRKSEFLLQDAEWLSTMSGVLFGTPFPKAELRGAWETVLTNQFHDIIPGSSIKEVYDQSDIDYAEVQSVGESICNGAKQAIASALSGKHGWVIFNPHSFEANGFTKINGKTAYVSGIAPKGYSCVTTPVFENHVCIDGNCVETNCFSVTFDEAWQITSIYDKAAKREVLSLGQIGNEIRIYPDHPDRYDNWEWQEYSLDTYQPLTDVSGVETVDDGARRGIRITRRYKRSTLVQTLWFYDDLARIDFDTCADWHEHHLMVKAAFPVDVQSERATYEIQFGAVERPTHKNTSWERAKFEVCAHKYADLSDNGYGVALLNDCKYGYDIHDGVMQLSLFKCGTYPNPEADQGEHRFIYALYPHEKPLAETDVAKEAYLLNDPLTAVAACGKKDRIPASYSILTMDSDHVLCEVVKEAEKGEDLILRLYEYKNRKGSFNLTLGFDIEEVWTCDLLENKQRQLPVNNRCITLPISNFEIVTLRIKRA
ncbi:MAG: alpha-mannosidase [Clostridia bacterium]|nr:alpha-mannosidase [Clostridia bacterium]